MCRFGALQHHGASLLVRRGMARGHRHFPRDVKFSRQIMAVVNFQELASVLQ
jgi:hypothetical protein